MYPPRGTPPSPPSESGQEPVDEDEGGALVTRIGTVVGGGVTAAIVASLPAVLRMGDGGSMGRALDEWLAAAGVLTPLAILAVGVFRRGRAGMKILAGEHATVLAAFVMWWAVLEASVLALIGAGLRARTHHHGLAGVTFAAFGLVSGLVVALLAVRGARMLARLPDSSQRLALFVAAGASFIVIMLVGVRTAKAESLHTAAALVDVLALAVASAIMAAKPFRRVRTFAIVGVPLAAMVMLLGFATLHAQGDLREAFAANAPLHAWVADLFPH